jgi:DNA polymerase-3 subunit beta
MKLTVNQKVLEKALAHATWIIEKKQAVPVLGYILFSTTPDKKLSITATNMDMAIVDVLECQVIEGGQYCLPAGLLYDITRKMVPGSNVTFEFDKSTNSVKMTSNRASFSIHHIEAASFPPIAATDYSVSFQMNTKTFKKAIDVAKVAMLLDNTRFHLNGIHWHYENDLGQSKICFVATDLFRISCVSTSAPAIAQKMEPIIVSKRTVWEILKLIDGSSDDEIKISLSENKIAFGLVTSEGILSEFSSRLINGTFPEYKAALNVSNDKVLVVNTKDLVAALDRVSTVVMDSTSSVKLEISQDKLVLTGISRELGSATEEIDASFNAFEPLEICFNSRFLLEIVREIETPQVTILLAESKSSTIIKPTIADTTPTIDMCFAVMPIEVVSN